MLRIAVNCKEMCLAMFKFFLSICREVDNESDLTSHQLVLKLFYNGLYIKSRVAHKNN